MRLNQKMANERVSHFRNIWKRTKSRETQTMPIGELREYISEHYMWTVSDDRDNVEVFLVKDKQAVTYWDWSWTALSLEDQSMQEYDEAIKSLDTWIENWVKPGATIVVLLTHDCPGCCQEGPYTIGFFDIVDDELDATDVYPFG